VVGLAGVWGLVLVLVLGLGSGPTVGSLPVAFSFEPPLQAGARTSAQTATRRRVMFVRHQPARTVPYRVLR
jgi:hypothetical protein